MARTGETTGQNPSENAGATPDHSAIKWQNKGGEPTGPYGNDPHVRMVDEGPNSFGAGQARGRHSKD